MDIAETATEHSRLLAVARLVEACVREVANLDAQAVRAVEEDRARRAGERDAGLSAGLIATLALDAMALLWDGEVICRLSSGTVFCNGGCTSSFCGERLLSAYRM